MLRAQTEIYNYDTNTVRTLYQVGGGQGQGSISEGREALGDGA